MAVRHHPLYVYSLHIVWRTHNNPHNLNVNFICLIAATTTLHYTQKYVSSEIEWQNVLLFHGKQEVSKVCISAVMCAYVTTAAATSTTITTTITAITTTATIKGDFSTLNC